MGSSCTSQFNHSSIQPIISLTITKKDQNLDGEIKLPDSKKMNQSSEKYQIRNKIHQNQKKDFKKEEHVYSDNFDKLDNLIERLDDVMKNQEKQKNQKESKKNSKRLRKSIEFYSSQKKNQITKNVNDAAIPGCFFQRIKIMEKNFFIDPKTNRIVPNLKPLRNNNLYRKRLTTEDELETDISIKFIKLKS